MDKLLKERYAEYVCTEKNQMEFEPKFYRISDKNEEQQLTQLIESNPQLVIIDEIESQLKELLKLKHPDKQLTSAELHSLVNKRVGNITYDQYGVWVYYPWRNTLVHLLDEKEFVEVRTNRNQYKITPEEEELGNNGQFLYPNDELIAHAVGILDAISLEHAFEYDKNIMQQLRSKYIQKRIEKDSKTHIQVDYNLVYPNVIPLNYKKTK